MGGWLGTGLMLPDCAQCQPPSSREKLPHVLGCAKCSQVGLQEVSQPARRLLYNLEGSATTHPPALQLSRICPLAKPERRCVPLTTPLPPDLQLPIMRRICPYLPGVPAKDPPGPQLGGGPWWGAWGGVEANPWPVGGAPRTGTCRRGEQWGDTEPPCRVKHSKDWTRGPEASAACGSINLEGAGANLGYSHLALSQPEP